MSDNTRQNDNDSIRTFARTRNLGKVQVTQMDMGGGAENPEVLVKAGQQTMAASLPVVLASNQPAIPVTGDFYPATQPISDSTDIEYAAVAALVTAAGDTVLYTPATGRRIRLHWSYAINDPSATTPARITIRLGPQTKYIVYALSKRQRDTGPVDGPLIVNLSTSGNVACTFRIEEI